jgi:hypothetical protein
LDFGRNGWDCVVVHPVLLQPSAELPAGDVELLERMVRNQDLLLVGRGGAGAVVTEEDAAGFFSRWFRNALPMAPVP